VHLPSLPDADGPENANIAAATAAIMRSLPLRDFAMISSPEPYRRCINDFDRGKVPILSDFGYSPTSWDHAMRAAVSIAMRPATRKESIELIWQAYSVVSASPTKTVGAYGAAIKYRSKLPLPFVGLFASWWYGDLRRHELHRCKFELRGDLRAFSQNSASSVIRRSIEVANSASWPRHRWKSGDISLKPNALQCRS